MGTIFVYNKKYTGKYYWTERRKRISGVFTYDDTYLTSKDNWNIDPSFILTAGAQLTKNGLPGSFADASPDRWGKTLIRHRSIRDAGKNGVIPRSLNDIDIYDQSVFYLNALIRDH